MTTDVGVGQLVEELEQRGDRLPFEIGAFVALEACEGLLQESVRLEPDDVRVTVEGSVVVADSAASADPDEAARSLVSVLARLLVAAGPGVPPYLLQLVKESATGQSPRDLRYLHDAIEASLIPINRGASRRVLARLVRDSDRPPAPQSAQVDPHELDAELDELLRDPALRTLEPTRTAPDEVEDDEPVTERIRIPRGVRAEARESRPDEAELQSEAVPKSFPPPVPDLEPETLLAPTSEPARHAAALPISNLKPPAGPAAAALDRADRPSEPITATIRKWQADEEAPGPESAPASASVSVPASVGVSQAVALTEPELETASESVFGMGSVSASESIPAPEPALWRESRPTASPVQSVPERPSLPEQPPRRRGGWGIWLLVAAFGAGAIWLVASGPLNRLIEPQPPATEAAPSGIIDVSVTPADSQIFVFVGRGPVSSEGLSTEGAHEFVVFEEGLRPSRAVVPAGAIWSTRDRGPLYELAVQAQPATDSARGASLGTPQTEPSTTLGGPTGTIRVITNPPGAKVFRYVGKGPSAEIPVSSIHEGQEVLVYHAGYETRRSVIGPSDWRQTDPEAGHTASLTVLLPALAESASPVPVED